MTADWAEDIGNDDGQGPDFDDDGDWEPCEHECDEACEDYQGFDVCAHSHCPACGGCRCPGYCDDYQTYNVRPFSETGGAEAGEPT